MSLLTLIQQATDELGLQRPSSVANAVTADDTVRQLVALANREGEELARRHAWTALQREHQFATVAGTAAYALPQDFDRFLDDTQWDRANRWALAGPIGPQQWQALKSGAPGLASRRRFRILGGVTTAFRLDPIPAASGDLLVFEYVTRNWCRSLQGAEQNAWAADDDAGLISERLMLLGLKWRFLRAIGMAYDQEQDDYERAVRAETARDGGAPVLRLGARPTPSLADPAVPDRGFGS
jgi:hypothetical protein